MNEAGAGNVVLAATTTATIVTAINEYATVISIGLTILGLLMALYFHIMNRIHEAKKLEEWRSKERLRIKTEVLTALVKEGIKAKDTAELSPDKDNYHQYL